jgi:hypothetical protein
MSNSSEYSISLEIKYKNELYTLEGRINNTEKYINIYFSECLGIGFRKEENLFFLDNIATTRLVINEDGIEENAKYKCFKSPLKHATMDEIVMIGLEIISFIGEQKTPVGISDLATKNNFSLSWLKFFRNKETAYSKFGFQLREPKSLNNFNDLMNETESYLDNQVSNITLKKLNLEAIAPITYRQYIQFLIQNPYEKDGSIITPNDLISLYLKFEEKPLNINGIWYLDWNFYNSLPNKAKVTKILKFKSLGK